MSSRAHGGVTAPRQEPSGSLERRSEAKDTTGSANPLQSLHPSDRPAGAGIVQVQSMARATAVMESGHVPYVAFTPEVLPPDSDVHQDFGAAMAAATVRGAATAPAKNVGADAPRFNDLRESYGSFSTAELVRWAEKTVSLIMLAAGRRLVLNW